MKLKNKDIPIIKAKLLEKQNGFCPVCKRNLYLLKSRDVCLDHNHVTGRIRAVLCRGCNSLEGKYYRAFIRVGHKNQGVDYLVVLEGLSQYFTRKDTKYVHPKHKEKGK